MSPCAIKRLGPINYELHSKISALICKGESKHGVTNLAYMTEVSVRKLGEPRCKLEKHNC